MRATLIVIHERHKEGNGMGMIIPLRHVTTIECLRLLPAMEQCSKQGDAPVDGPRETGCRFGPDHPLLSLSACRVSVGSRTSTASASPLPPITRCDGAAQFCSSNINQFLGTRSTLQDRAPIIPFPTKGSPHYWYCSQRCLRMPCHCVREQPQTFSREHG